MFIFINLDNSLTVKIFGRTLSIPPSIQNISSASNLSKILLCFSLIYFNTSDILSNMFPLICFTPLF